MVLSLFSNSFAVQSIRMLFHLPLIILKGVLSRKSDPDVDLRKFNDAHRLFIKNVVDENPFEKLSSIAVRFVLRMLR